MDFKPTIHHRAFGLQRTQVTLAELPADAEGFVRFWCRRCPRTDRIPLATLKARFAPEAGLVNILNAIKPPDCPLAGEDAQGNHPCDYRYRDLGGRR